MDISLFDWLISEAVAGDWLRQGGAEEAGSGAAAGGMQVRGGEWGVWGQAEPGRWGRGMAPALAPAPAGPQQAPPRPAAAAGLPAGLSPGLPERAHRHPDRQTAGYGPAGPACPLREPPGAGRGAGSGEGRGGDGLAPVPRVRLPRGGLSPAVWQLPGPAPGVALGCPSPGSTGVTPRSFPLPPFPGQDFPLEFDPAAWGGRAAPGAAFQGLCSVRG